MSDFSADSQEYYRLFLERCWTRGRIMASRRFSSVVSLATSARFSVIECSAFTDKDIAILKSILTRRSSSVAVRIHRDA